MSHPFLRQAPATRSTVIRDAGSGGEPCSRFVRFVNVSEGCSHPRIARYVVTIPVVARVNLYLLHDDCLLRKSESDPLLLTPRPPDAAWATLCPAVGPARVSCERASELGLEGTGSLDAVGRWRKLRSAEQPVRAVCANDPAVTKAGADGGSEEGLHDNPARAMKSAGDRARPPMQQFVDRPKCEQNRHSGAGDAFQFVRGVSFCNV
jgi:hypothetical protein